MTDLKTQAAAYAKAATSTRCLRMGECENCSVKHCDYRSRVEAYIAGHRDAMRRVIFERIPQDDLALTIVDPDSKL